MSNLKELTEYTDTFLQSEHLKVMSIRGEWGTGKTYFWKEHIKNLVPKYKINEQPTCNFTQYDFIDFLYYIYKLIAYRLKYFRLKILKRHTVKQNIIMKHDDDRYAYVSLFGINTINELKEKIFCALKLENKFYATAMNATPRKYRNLTKTGLKIWCKKSIKDILICMDDFERKGKLDLKDIFGYVSHLKEEKNCKIVLIFNENQLDPKDKEIYEAYREKIFDKQFSYEPTPADSLKIAMNEFPKSEHKPLVQYILTEKCNLIKLNNIRIIQKIIYHCIEWIDFFKEIVNPYISKEDYIKIIVPNIVFLTFLYEIKDQKLDIWTYLKNHRSLKFILIGLKDDEFNIKYEEINKIEQEIEEKISAYKDDLTYPIDLEIMKFIEKGYISAEIKQNINNILDPQQQKLKQLTDEYWNLYRNTLADNESDCIEKANELYYYLLNGYNHEKSNLELIGGGLNTLVILKDDSKIDDIIKKGYTNIDSSLEKIIKLNEYIVSQRRGIFDKKVLERIEIYYDDMIESYKEELQNIPFYDFLKEAKSFRNKQPEIFEKCHKVVLQSKTKEELKKLLLETHSEDVMGLYPNFLCTHIQQQFQDALQEIYDEYETDFAKNRLERTVKNEPCLKSLKLKFYTPESN